MACSVTVPTLLIAPLFAFDKSVTHVLQVRADERDGVAERLRIHMRVLPAG